VEKPVFVVVTGGRTYSDYRHVAAILDEERKRVGSIPFAVVQGGAKGADRLAKLWCQNKGVPCFEVEAMWDKLGRSAGHIRNSWMLDYLPIYKVIAFPGGKGTENAVKQATIRSILVRDERFPLKDV
jgi:hypothetical protein